MNSNENYPSLETTLHQQLETQIHPLSVSNQVFQNFSVIQFHFPYHFSTPNPISLLKTYKNPKFLVYIISESTKSSILQNICKTQITVPDSEQSEFVSITRKSHLKIRMACEIPKNFFIFSRISFLEPSKQANTLKTSKPINENFQISQFVEGIKSEILDVTNKNILLEKIIQLDLSRKRIEWKSENGKTSFLETRKGLVGFRMIKIEIESRKRVFWIRFRLICENGQGFQDHFGEDKEEILKAYVKEINKKIVLGRFWVSKTIFYDTSFHSCEVIKENMGLYELIQKDLDKFYSHCDNFFKIFKNDLKFKSIPFEITKKSYQNLKRTEIQLSFQQYLKEKEILRQFEKSSGQFFMNRFNYNKTTNWPNNYIVCYSYKNSESFESFLRVFPTQAINSIVMLIDELARIGLKFKGNMFLAESFEWFEERLAYKYDLPLCQVLKIVKNSEFGSLDNEKILAIGIKTKRKLFSQIFQFHKHCLDDTESDFTAEECLLLYKNSDFIELKDEIAKERLNIYKSNRISSARPYFGIALMCTRTFLICSKGFHQDLTEKLEDQTSLSQFSDFFSQFLFDFFAIIEELLQKPTNLCCIDPACIGFTEKNKLFFEIRSSSEVQSRYKAPEVQNGRSNKLSLIYSFGKILEHCFFFFFCLKQSLDYTQCEENSTTKQAFSHYPYLQELISGCTSTKIKKRWTIEKLKPTLQPILQTLKTSLNYPF